MVPEGGEISSEVPDQARDDVMLAGYRECATEALTWLHNLGYEPGHPLIRSLVAHLTKKQAYLEKLNLERFLIEETAREVAGEEGADPDPESEQDLLDSVYELCAQEIMTNEDIQKALVDAVYKGCDLQYKAD